MNIPDYELQVFDVNMCILSLFKGNVAIYFNIFFTGKLK